MSLKRVSQRVRALHDQVGMAGIETAVSRIAGPAGSLHVDDGGWGGVPVALLHSFAGSTRHWASQLDHLRDDRRAIAFDLRGHGESDAPSDGDYTAEALARDVAAVVDTLKLKRVVLVGHSMGGSAAIAYANAHPDRVAGRAGRDARTHAARAGAADNRRHRSQLRHGDAEVLDKLGPTRSQTSATKSPKKRG